MIEPTRSSHRSPQLEPITTSGPGTERAQRTRLDRVATGSVTFLRAELLRQPEVRPEVLERARALAADPNYPPASMNQALAQLILGAPDQSEVSA